MRLWSLHPRYLDRQGLTATWREALLAQAVLAGRTRGYTRHPQLLRFRDTNDPIAAVGAYLGGVHAEATARGYSFDAVRIDRSDPGGRWAGVLEVTAGQLGHEWQHLIRKLRVRSPALAQDHTLGVLLDHGTPVVAAHPVFTVVPGPVAHWEVVNPAGIRPAPRPGAPGPASA